MHIFNALRLRFRFVASDFPGIVYILNGDRSGAVVLGGEWQEDSGQWAVIDGQ